MAQHPQMDVDPSPLSRRTIRLASVALGLCWVWHGLVPKLLFIHTGELEMVTRSGLFPGHETLALTLLGVAEMALGIALAVFPRRWMHRLSVTALLLLCIGAVWSKPVVYLAPFSPFSVSVALIGLSLIAWIHLPAPAAPEPAAGPGGDR